MLDMDNVSLARSRFFSMRCASASIVISSRSPKAPARDESPLDFKQALKALEGVSDRDSIAHIVLRASRSKVCVTWIAIINKVGETITIRAR